MVICSHKMIEWMQRYDGNSDALQSFSSWDLHSLRVLLFSVYQTVLDLHASKHTVAALVWFSYADLKAHCIYLQEINGRSEN